MSQVLIVTWAGQGIGKAIVEAAPPNTEIINIGLPHYDVRNIEDIRSSVSSFKHIDWIVNNAGVNSSYRIQAMAPAEWSRIIDTNLTGIYNVLHVCVPLMSTTSSIVNIASMIAHRASGIRNFNSHYCASKGGVISMTRSLAQELAPIRVNSVSPGIIVTEMTEADHPLYQYMCDRILLGRRGTVEDVAKAVWFLLDNEQSGYITGADLLVDGGYSAH